jgi:hypothetical protein
MYQDVEIDVCPACQSIWLDRGEYDRIIQKKRKKKANGDGGADVDIDISSSSTGCGCEPDTGMDFDFDAVADFLGDAVGSLLDGL